VPGERDIFGRTADADMKKAHREDTRLAGVALVSFPTPGHDATAPHWLAVTLTVGDTNLGASSKPTLRIRKKDLPDVADQAERTIDLDILVGNLGVTSAPASALLGTPSTWLVVWTTSGAMSWHRVFLWLPDNVNGLPINDPTGGLFKDTCDGVRLRTVPFYAGGTCRTSSASPACTSGVFNDRSYGWVQAPTTGLIPVVSTNFAAAGLAGSNVMKVTEVSGRAISTSATGVPKYALARRRTFAAGIG